MSMITFGVYTKGGGRKRGDSKPPLADKLRLRRGNDKISTSPSWKWSPKPILNQLFFLLVTNYLSVVLTRGGSVFQGLLWVTVETFCIVSAMAGTAGIEWARAREGKGSMKCRVSPHNKNYLMAAQLDGGQLDTVETGFPVCLS